MKNVIHIYGASGSGTTTLGRKISEELGYKFMDTDDYFWLPTNPQYTTKRSKEERDAYILGVDEAIEKYTGKIIAIVHRNDDVEEKWVVAPEGVTFTKEDVRELIHFQEQYFDSEVVM